MSMSIFGPGGLDPSQLAQVQVPSMTPPSVGPGSPPQSVQGVQNSLQELGYKVEAGEDQADVYGPSTQAAVSQFQKDHQLPQTGIADGQTRMSMLQELQRRQQMRQEIDAFEGQLQKAMIRF
jgi:peptidoglycan hydrolase-like protein with peptidoglycan-binding domain